jgi:hypothetical protein
MRTRKSFAPRGKTMVCTAEKAETPASNAPRRNMRTRMIGMMKAILILCAFWGNAENWVRAPNFRMLYRVDKTEEYD